MTILDSLRGINAYPISLRTLDEAMTRRGLNGLDEATQEVLQGKDYNLAIADLLIWLACAPAISQGGQSYSFTDEQRQQFRNRAHQLWDGYDDDGLSTTQYGYKGDRF